ncbi:MAG: amidohydrolase family protein [Vicinamibacterales bacterium]
MPHRAHTVVDRGLPRLLHGASRRSAPRARYAAALVAACAATALACGGPAPSEAPSPTNVTVFEGARLITGEDTVPIENAVFVVADGRFTQVGEAGTVTIPEGAARIDLTGRTVMPAIVDSHTHLSQTRDALVEDLQRRAYYGIGVAASLGQDQGEAPFQVRAETIPDAARFRTAGRGITAPEPGRSEVPYWITTEAEARAAVQEQAASQVDLVKIWVDDRNGQYQKLSPALYGAVIDEAHKAGLRVTAHIFALEDAKGLLRAGIDAFAHGVRDRDIDEEGLALFRDRPNVYVVPNMPDRGVAQDYGWLAESLPAEEVARLQEASTDRPDAQATFGIQARNLKALSDAGVKIAFGTDGNTPWAPHVEMADMVASGMTPAQVIVAATRTSAELLQVADAGTVAPGMSADFIVLEANPLDDITNTRRIVNVYLRGAAVDRAGLRAAWASGPAEPAGN